MLKGGEFELSTRFRFALTSSFEFRASNLLTLSQHGNDDRSRLRRVAVLKNEDSLPGAEGESAVDNRNLFRGACQDHAQVAGHVVGTFERVCVPGRILGNEALKERLQVHPRRGIGVLV